MISSKTKNSSAADELIKATCDQVECIMSIDKETVLSHLASDISSLDKKIGPFHRMVESKLKVLTDSIDGLTRTIQENSQIQNFNWAISNTIVGSFEYYAPDGRCINSIEVARTVLCAFKLGQYYLVNGCSCLPYSTDINENIKNEQNFREKLSQHIFLLLAVVPVWKKHTEGWAIHFR